MKRTIILHPLLFAAFPVLFFFSKNAGEYRLGEMLKLLAEVVALTAVVWAALGFLLRNARRAALLVSLAAVLVSSHGHAKLLLYELGFLGVPLIGWGPSTAVSAIWSAAFFTGAFFAIRTRSGLSNPTRILNLCAVVLVVHSTVAIAVFQARVREARKQRAIQEGTIFELDRPRPARNVYYIILDAYGRSDQLRDLYGYDNSALISFLEDRGFYVAAKSTANYSYTIPSVATSLNMNYLFDAEGIYDARDWVPIQDAIAHSKVSRLLKDAGYRFIYVEGKPDEVANADVYMRPWKRESLTEGFLQTTAAGAFTSLAERKRREVIYPFEKLPETAGMRGPLFVFAHIMSPHRPFVFSSDGSDPGAWGRADSPPTNMVSRKKGITRTRYKTLYREQIAYVDKLLMKAVDGILQNSKTTPIIVIQSDHGPGAYLHPEDVDHTYLAERMSILNAYLLPEGGSELLYDSITPVNTFRLIFSRYFGVEVELLGDRNIFTAPEHQQRMRDVTDEIGNEDDCKRREKLDSLEYFDDGGEAGKESGG